MRGLRYYWEQLPTKGEYLKKYGLNRLVLLSVALTICSILG